MAREVTVSSRSQVRGQWWAYVPLAALAISIGYLVGSGWLLLAAGGASIAAATFIAYRWPVTAAMLVLLISGGYSIFTMVPGWDIKGTTVGGGVRLEDVFMVGMLLAGLLRLATPAGRTRSGKLLVPFLLLGMWLAFETVRNVATVGLSAPGELRFFYLLLAVAFCLVVSIDRESLVRTGLRGFALLTVALPIVLFPLVVYLKGWSFGPSARIFPANVSLGLLLGLAVLWQCRGLVRWPGLLLYAATVFGVVEILLDAHRSVWLSTIVLLGLVFARQRLEGKVRWLFVGILVVAVAVVVAHGLGYDVVSIVTTRVSTALTGQDTAGIRISMWKAAAPLIASSPVVGRGLGLYWNLYLRDVGYAVNVFPHSVYVMVLADLGAVGMVLLVLLWVQAWRVLASGLGVSKRGVVADGFRPVCASLGLGTLGVIAAYGVAYGFEPYSVTLAGICLAGSTVAPRLAGRPEVPGRLD